MRKICAFLKSLLVTYALRQHHVPQNPLTAYDFISRSVFSSPVFRDAQMLCILVSKLPPHLNQQFSAGI